MTAIINGHNQLTDFDFEVGDVYLFHTDDPACPADSSLWAVFDKRVGGRVFLNSVTDDLTYFDAECRLPLHYRYCRIATKAELRDFAFALGRFEGVRVETMPNLR